VTKLKETVELDPMNSAECFRVVWNLKQLRVKAHILMCFLAFVMSKTLGKCRK